MTRTARFMQHVDGIVIRITDHVPSTRALVSVLAMSMLTLLFLALTGPNPHASHTGDGEASVTAATAVEAPVTPPASEAVTPPRRIEPAVAAAPALQPTVPPSAPVVAAALPARVTPAEPVQRIEVRQGDAPPRVIDMARTEPLSTRAAEIVRADPLPPRVADAPRPEGAVGATSRTPVENTLSSAPARPRDAALEATPARDESTKASLEPRLPAERAPSSEPASGGLTGL